MPMNDPWMLLFQIVGVISLVANIVQLLWQQKQKGEWSKEREACGVFVDNFAATIGDIIKNTKEAKIGPTMQMEKSLAVIEALGEQAKAGLENLRRKYWPT
jgi:hypothetical protein